MLLCGPENVVVDEAVVAKERQLVLHVLEETSDESGEVDDMGGLVLVKDGGRVGEGPGGGGVRERGPLRRVTLPYSPQVSVLGAEKDPLLPRGRLSVPAPDRLVLDNKLESASDEACGRKSKMSSGRGHDNAPRCLPVPPVTSTTLGIILKRCL